MNIFSKAFWVGAGERAFKTGIQFAILTGFGLGVIDPANMEVVSAFGLPYLEMLGAFLGGVLISALTSVVVPAQVPVIEKGTGKRVAE